MASSKKSATKGRTSGAKSTTAKKKRTQKTSEKRKSVKKKTTKKVVASTAKSASSAKSVTKTAKKKVAKKRQSTRTKSAKKKSTVTITLETYDTKNVPEEKQFYFVNGERVKNIKELAEIMDRIEQEVFDYHVNEEKNDFYNWIRHVFNDIELAEKVVGVTGPKHLQFTIYKHVADKALKKK